MFVVQNRLLRSLLLLAGLFMVLPLQAQDLPPLTHGITKLKATFPAPELKYQNMDDELVDLTELRGKTVVVNFWATWCPPCRREMGSLERLHLAVADRGVEVLAVNIGEDEDTVFSFLGTVAPSPTFPILFDKDAESMDNWQVKGLPTTYIVSKAGMVTYRVVGGREFDHPDLIDTILSLQSAAE